jgi:hypothetical protein
MLLSGGLAVLLSLLAFSHAGAQTCVQPPSGLVSWWPGDGNANDLKNVNDGTLQGDATFAAGMVGQAFSLDGVGDFVEAPENGSLDLNGPFTIDLWVKPDPLDAGGPLVSKYDRRGDLGLLDTSYHLDFLYFSPTDQRIQFGVRCGVFGMTRETAPGMLPLGVFIHVAAVYDNDPSPTVEVYVNGVRQEGLVSGSCDGINQNDTPFSIGKRTDLAGGEQFFHGLIDEVEVFNRALSASEIQAIYNAGSAGKCLVGITAVGGTPQECAEKGGSTVTFTASRSALPPGYLIEWFLDPDLSNPIGSGETVTAFIPLGQHTIYAKVTTPAGDTRIESSPIEIVDTIVPKIAISFSDLSGQAVTGVSRHGLNWVVVNFQATDVCDPDPSATATGGVSITSGDVVQILPARGQITLTGENFAATVTATDASGNVVQDDAFLAVVE